MAIPNNDKALQRQNYRLKFLRHEFAQAVMRHDYPTADRMWNRMNRIECRNSDYDVVVEQEAKP